MAPEFPQTSVGGTLAAGGVGDIESGVAEAEEEILSKVGEGVKGV
jgi:hypothetical protein